MTKWTDSKFTLGERCIAFAENELKNGVKESYLGSYTSPRIKEYFSICTRVVNGKETKIGIQSGNWCAASASFTLKESLLDDKPTHGYRVGVVEIVDDLIKNNLYFEASKVRDKLFIPQIGDVIIFDRSVKGDPSTAWYRHIGRVYSFNKDEFECISGNSGGEWKVSKHKIDQATLLGFGSASFACSISKIEPEPLQTLSGVSEQEDEFLLGKVINDYFRN